jgi:hypothetical protein
VPESSALNFDGVPVAEIIKTIIDPRIAELEKAVRAKSSARFMVAFDELTSGCNSCHAGANKPALRGQRRQSYRSSPPAAWQRRLSHVPNGCRESIPATRQCLGWVRPGPQPARAACPFTPPGADILRLHPSVPFGAPEPLIPVTSSSPAYLGFIRGNHAFRKHSVNSFALTDHP